MRICITCWRSITDPIGTRVRTTWQAFTERMAHPLIAKDKLTLPGFALATFEGNRRAKAGVKSVYCIGFDFDDLCVTFEELCNAFSAATVLHTTWSHTSDAPRARAFSLLSRPVSAVEYEAIWKFIAATMTAAGQAPDGAAKDASRLWFAPAIHPDTWVADPKRGFSHRSIDGSPIDVDVILASIPPEDRIAPASIPITPTMKKPPTTVVDRARKYLASCPVAIAGQNGHHTTFLIAQKLVRGFGLDVSTAFELLVTLWNPSCLPPWPAADLIRKLKQAESVGRMPVGALRDRRRRTAS